MLLTITTTHQSASDLSWLLHKQPDKCQAFSLGFGTAYVFYPQVSDTECSACLLLDVDPVALVRGRPGALESGPLDQYVNDRPYVVSSLMSVAISRVFASALNGTCNRRPELIDREFPLVAKLEVLPCRGGEGLLDGLFAPLGYGIEATRCPLDPVFSQWGESPYFSVALSKTTTLQTLLTQLYVLIPVLDNYKHYYVGESELTKLLEKGHRWLGGHPQREIITRRYLKYQGRLARRAIECLEEGDPSFQDIANPSPTEQQLEEPPKLNQQRMGAVIAALKAAGAKHVIDLGCGEGRLLRTLLSDKSFGRIAGMDVSSRTLERAAARLKLEELPDRQRKRIELIHGSLMYRDQRLTGYDAATVVEVIEHLEAYQLIAFERVLFEFARPQTVVLTTPNGEYNGKWAHIGATGKRHRDHRFEWTRDQFNSWADTICARFGYRARVLGIGETDEALGAPTQLGIFSQDINGGAQ